MAAELLTLVDAGTIRVIDILILARDAEGVVEAMERSDVGDLGELQAIEAELAELLVEEDVEHLAAAMGRTAWLACSSTRMCRPRHSHQPRGARVDS